MHVKLEVNRNEITNFTNGENILSPKMIKMAIFRKIIEISKKFIKEFP